MRIRRLMAVAAALFLLASITIGSTAAFAVEPIPSMPAAYYGQVFVGSHGGQPAADGATVEVYLEGDTAPRGTSMQVEDGWYGGPGGFDPKYQVDGTSSDIGKEVIFKVNGVEAETFNASGAPVAVTFDPTGEPVQVDLVIPAARLTLVRPENLNAAPYTAADAVFEWQSDLALDPDAAVTATFSDGTNSVDGAVYFSADAMNFTVQPKVDLLPGTAYTLTVSGLKDAAGNPVNLEPVEFTTAPAGPAAQVSGVEPAVVLPGGTITVSGQNFRAGAKLVIFDAQNQVARECTASVADENTLTCVVPADLAAGLYTINVYNVGDERPVSGAVALTVAAAEVPKLDLLKGSAGSQPATDLKTGDVFRVQVPVTVARDVPNALIVVRLDDPDGKPLLAFMEGPLDAGRAVNFGAGFTLPEKPGTYAARAYVWDGWDTMNPVAAAQEISFAVR
ncbi:Ig-like domain-containing protein [Desulfofundulus thermocisternus]|uniref:Ig-like domain-containing protein n=1 Tax=Desulfofundulus thermocisternus TaxID=42471 RepID=UPI000489BC47|nr:Ig-like domain-containing protein [Desulfofundulus thermocisternus]